MLDILRKKLLYRSAHRGCKEMDIIFSRFTKAHLASLSQEEIESFDKFLNENELDIREWVIEQKNIPIHYQNLVKNLNDN